MMYIGLFILGILFGSFINALVWRLHEQLDDDGNPKKLTKKQAKELSITKGRSMCPHCHHELAPKDLVPIVSWLMLGGKCRYCSKPISIEYPAIELLTGLLFVISYAFWPYGFGSSWLVVWFITWLIVLIGLIALAIYDIKWMLLPDKIVFKLYLVVFFSYIIQLALGRPVSAIATALLGSLVGGGIFWVLYQVSGGRWIGGGDVKLGFLLGAMVGSGSLAFLILFFSSVIGIIWVIPSLLSKRLSKTSKVPYGPFLIIASGVVMLWGQHIIDWYSQTFLSF